MDITQYPVVTRVTTLSLLLGTLSGCDLFNKDDETEAPEASFSVNETSGTAPVTVTFTDTSEDGSDDIYQWLWEFGDGNTSSLQNPQHDYPIPGTYTVSLTVTSEDGADTDLWQKYTKAAGYNNTLSLAVGEVETINQSAFAGVLSDTFAQRFQQPTIK